MKTTETTSAARSRADTGAGGLLPYRPALDGVRAIAVIAVFAYHLGLPMARGGFLGVDIFFVLSGYLITSLLLIEHDRTGHIDLLRFWVRRARRLLPALLLALLAVAVWVHLTASDFQMAQGRLDLQWALFYGSNWHLIESSQDYFAQGAGVSLVRHTWSLAIEEQFYLAWPLVVTVALWLARARTRVLVAICAVGTLGSVAAMALLHSISDPSRAYYGTDARIHQLLIGALLAVAMLRAPRVLALRQLGSATAAASLAVLATAFMTVGDDMIAYYRGGSALIAIVAAALIWGLQVAPEERPAKVLSAAPLRGLGLISYGVYLWHWPVILMVGAPAAAFAWLPGNIGLNVTRVVITMACAGLSFVAVERPIRRGAMPTLLRSLPRFGVATAGVLVTVAVVIGVLTKAGLQAEATTHGGAAQIDKEGCHYEVCLRHRAGPGAPIVAVIGDSIARSMDVGFLDEARRRGFTYLMAANDGCRVTHLLTTTAQGSGEYEICYERTQNVWHDLATAWQPDLVIVVQDVEGNDFEVASGRRVADGSDEWAQAELREISRVARGFVRQGAKVVFLATQPAVMPERCQRASATDDPTCIVPASEDEIGAQLNVVLQAVTDRFHPDAAMVSVNDHLCPNGLCHYEANGLLPRYDAHHYSSAGARWVVGLLFEQMQLAGVWPVRGTA